MRLNVLLKAVVVGIVAAAFMIPLAMIWGVVKERSQYRDKVTAEVARSTARSQTLAGPLVVIRYRESLPPLTKNGVAQILERIDVVVPDSLQIRSSAQVQTRQRGIYRVPVFRSENRLSASFTMPARLAFGTGQPLEAPKVEVLFALSDPRGIRELPQVRIDGAAAKPYPTAGLGPVKHGFGVALPLGVTGRRVSVDAKLDLIGTDHLMFTPVGTTTDVLLTSTWPHPSFVGAFLPDDRRVSASGFEARWKLSRFATGINEATLSAQLRSPQSAPPDDDDAPGSSTTDLGVRFVQPVDVYSQSERAVKYGILFVFLTFVAFFLFEVLRRMAVHPIQYTLCGAALALFFLLLVSLSEHLPFGAAYMTASAACVGLIAFYVGHVLRSAGRGVLFGGLLGALYGFLYIILLSEDYALLLGAALLFIALTSVMIITRRVDWYRLSEPPPSAPEGPA